MALFRTPYLGVQVSFHVPTPTGCPNALPSVQGIRVVEWQAFPQVMIQPRGSELRDTPLTTLPPPPFSSSLSLTLCHGRFFFLPVSAIDSKLCLLQGNSINSVPSGWDEYTKRNILVLAGAVGSSLEAWGAETRLDFSPHQLGTSEQGLVYTTMPGSSAHCE